MHGTVATGSGSESRLALAISMSRRPYGPRPPVVVVLERLV